MATLTASVPYEASRQQRLIKARRRSGLVRLTRVVAPGMIFALLAAALFLLVRGAQENAIARLPDLSSVRIINPRFTGTDSAGRSYMLAADSATRDPNNPARIRLQNPDLARGNGDKDRMTVKALSGLYDEKTGALDLLGGVKGTAPGGYSFQTNAANVDVRQGIVIGESPVVGNGPLGEITAKAYAVQDDGRRVVFSGGVRARIQKQAR